MNSGNFRVTHITQDNFIQGLENFPKKDCSLDFEATGLEMWEIDDFLAFSFGVTTLDNPRRDIHYFTFEVLTRDQIAAFKKFVFERRVWVANAKYEGSIMWRMFGEMPKLDDIFAFFTALGCQGISLKEGAQKFLGVPDWSDAPWGCFKALKETMGYLRDRYKAHYENDKVKNIRPIAYFLNEGNIKSALEWVLNPENTLLVYERKVLKAINDVKEHLRPMDIIRCILGTNYDPDKVNLTYVDQKIVKNYCALDTIYCAEIKNKLDSEVTKEQYQIYLKQTYLATVFETYGAFWDVKKKNELKKYYLSELLKYYKILLSEPKFIVDCDPGNLVKLQSYETHFDIKQNIWNPGSTKPETINYFYDSLYESKLFHASMAAYKISVFTEKYDITITDSKDSKKEIHISKFIKHDTIKEYLIILQNFFIKRIPKDTAKRFLGSEVTDLDDFRECIQKARDVKHWFRGSLKEDRVVELYQAMRTCGDCDINDSFESMHWAFRLIVSFRMIKKLEKSLNTYICGQAIGEQNLSICNYNPDNIREVPLRTKNGFDHSFFNLQFRSNTANSKRWQAGVHCLIDSTRIQLSNGNSVSIGEIYENPEKEYLVFSVLNGNVVEKPIWNVHLSGYVNELIELEFENGHIVKCTPNHRFLMANGKYKEAQDITSEDEFFDWEDNIFLNDGDTLYSKETNDFLKRINNV